MNSHYLKKATLIELKSYLEKIKNNFDLILITYKLDKRFSSQDPIMQCSPIILIKKLDLIEFESSENFENINLIGSYILGGYYKYLDYRKKTFNFEWINFDRNVDISLPKDSFMDFEIYLSEEEIVQKLSNINKNDIKQVIKQL